MRKTVTAMDVVRLLRTSIIQKGSVSPGAVGALAGQLETNGWDRPLEEMVFYFKLGSAQRCYRLGSEQWYFSLKSVGFPNSEWSLWLWI